MAKLDEKIMRIEACLHELVQDREDFDKGKVALQLDARIAKTWVWQLDQAIELLTAMLDDWKEVSPDGAKWEAKRSEASGNGMQKGNPSAGTRRVPGDQGSTDDQ